MEKILQEFTDISDEPYKWLSEWKRANQRKVIGCYPMIEKGETIKVVITP